jgi:PAS domain S-box-containing protein
MITVENKVESLSGNLKIDDPVRILLVDDKKENLLSLEIALANEGYSFVNASSGREALKILLREQDFAIILMDVQMPGMDGFETAELIRQSERLKHVPIIFLTAALNAPDHIFKGYKAGAVDYMLKPISSQILKAKVAVFIDLYKMNRKLIEQGEYLKSLNRKLGKYSDDLLRINQELESFSYSVSHDLRAPLRAIDGFSQLLEQGYNERLDDEGKRFLNIIKYNSVKMGKLIDALLAFTHLGRNEFEKKEIDMNELTENLLLDINRTIKHHAKIELKQLPPAKCDAGLMHQVMFNLISNAIKYSSKKENPVVEIGSYADKEYGIVYYVKDNGAGFSMDHYNKLFGVFQRLHSVEEFEGTGIGLAMAHRIISKHGGRIWAEGKEGEGATFYFTPKQGGEQVSLLPQPKSIGDWEWNIARNAFTWSDELYNIYGLIPGETKITFEKMIQLSHPAEKDHIRKNIAEAKRTHEPLDFYHRILRPDNSERTLHVRGKVFTDESGTVVKIIGTEQDVTEQLLKEKMDELAMAATKSTNSVIIADKNGKIQWVNEGFEKLTGYTLDEVRYTNGEVLRKGIPTGLSPHSQFYKSMVTNKESVVYEGKNYSKSGSEYWVITTLTPMFGKNGEVERIIAIDSDITQRKKMEEDMILANQIAEHSLRKGNKALNDLMKAKKEVEESMKVKEQFLTKMSHEIRTPMNAIMGLTEILLEGNVSSEQKEYLEAVKISSDNLLTVINDILDFSKLESGKVSLESVPFKLSEIIEGVILTMRLSATRKGIELSYTIDEKIPSLISGDPFRLRQILLNLISNSVKFTEKGSVKIDAGLIGENENSCMIRFCISDTGIGIPENLLSTIFESFTQASNETSRKYGGTGLGLTIVKQLVELQDGSINVESEMGKGSEFIARLPFQKCDQSTIPVNSAMSKEPFQAIGPLRILLVEDNEMNQMVAQKVLSKWGFKTDVAANGKIGIEKIAAGEYDLVLMDIQMPEMDGYETTRYIRENMAVPKSAIPIIAMTAHAIVGEAEKCISLGMDDYISKPFNQKMLYEKIDLVLKKKQPGKIPHEVLEIKEDKEAGSKGFDLSYLTDIAEGNNDFIQRMINAFLLQTPVMLQDMVKFLDEKKWSELGGVAHKMKPSIEFVGIYSIRQTVHDLEKFASGQINLELIPDMVKEIDTVCNSTFVALKEVSESLSAKNDK